MIVVLLNARQKDGPVQSLPSSSPLSRQRGVQEVAIDAHHVHLITVSERVVLGQILQEREQLLVDADSEGLVVVAAGQVLYGHQAHHSLLLVGVAVRAHELVLEHLEGSFS